MGTREPPSLAGLQGLQDRVSATPPPERREPPPPLPAAGSVGIPLPPGEYSADSGSSDRSSGRTPPPPLPPAGSVGIPLGPGPGYSTAPPPLPVAQQPRGNAPPSLAGLQHGRAGTPPRGQRPPPPPQEQQWQDDAPPPPEWDGGDDGWADANAPPPPPPLDDGQAEAERMYRAQQAVAHAQSVQQAGAAQAAMADAAAASAATAGVTLHVTATGYWESLLPDEQRGEVVELKVHLSDTVKIIKSQLHHKAALKARDESMPMQDMQSLYLDTTTGGVPASSDALHQRMTVGQMRSQWKKSAAGADPIIRLSLDVDPGCINGSGTYIEWFCLFACAVMSLIFTGTLLVSGFLVFTFPDELTSTEHFAFVGSFFGVPSPANNICTLPNPIQQFAPDADADADADSDADADADADSGSISERLLVLACPDRSRS